MNVLFNRETLKAVGVNRPALPFEVEVANVGMSGQTKVVEYVEQEPTGLYWLPQPTIHFVTFDDGDPYPDGGEVHDVTQYPLQITVDDERYHDGLEPVMQDVTKTKTVTFEDGMEYFTYDDVVKVKATQIIKDSFYTNSVLYEDMSPEEFSTDLASFKADFGFGFISIPAGGEVRTVKLTLPISAKVIGVKVESSDSIDTYLGATVGDLQLLNKQGERKFDSAVNTAYVLLKNTSDKRIDVLSIALLML